MTQYELANAGAVAESSGREGLLERDTSRSIRPRSGWRVLALAFAGLVGLSATIATVILTAQAQRHNQLAALGQGIVTGVPVAVALYACRRGPYPRFAYLLLAAAVVWAVVGLSQSMQSVPYSIGRVAEWLVQPLVIYAVLAFPTGRLRSTRERVVVAASAAVVAVLYLPSALLVDQYPLPAPWTSCTASCPHNAFMVSASQPAFINSVLLSTRELAAQLLFLATVLILISRMRGASRLMRRAQGPVLTAAIALLIAQTVFLIERRAGVTGVPLDAVSWIWLLTLPGLAVAFLVGIVRWRLFTADALQRLTLAPGRRAGGDDMQHSLAAALDDPSLRVLYQVGAEGSGWVTATGEPAELPEPGSGLDFTELIGSRGQAVAIVHDEALSECRPLVQAAGTHMLVELENHSLQAQVRTSIRELAESRTQALAAGESARRKLRQNLHDGAQQRLVGLLVRLELAGPQVQQDPEGGARLLHDLADEVERTLADIRVLSHGLEPSVLNERGLSEALGAVVANAPLHTILDTDGVRRYSPEVEACVYFVCMEGLANAYKHASGATTISISLHEREELSFAVRDDGSGFNPGAVRSGLGMASMRQRLASVGGRLAITSTPGSGTVLTASIPLDSHVVGRPRPSA